MKFLPLPTTTATRAWIRCMSSTSLTLKKNPTKRSPINNTNQKGTEDRCLTFPALGLQPHFVDALHTAFPDVLQPTEVQGKLIPEVLDRKDILLKDVTGSGKTFGLVLGLLNKPRMVIEDEGKRRRVVTTLFIVPHRDLAHQIMHWIELLTKALKPSPPLSSIAQVLVRGSGLKRQDAITALRETPPHVLVCTPQALWEVYKDDKEVLQLDTLSTVVVDEMDYMVETDPKKYKKHPGPTRDILDVIYARRRELGETEHEKENKGEWINEREKEEGIPQLIVSSATLRVHFKNHLYAKSGWLNRHNVVKISGEKEESGKVTHSILVVTGNGVKNVEGAVKVEVAPEEAVMANGEENEEAPAAEEYYDEKYGQTPSPFDGEALEAVATGFALDVPSTGLLVIPSWAPVQRAVYELRTMGVDAEGLDMQKEKETGERGGPRLLVGTVATTRGVDMPWLSHVFILGLPEGRIVDGYTHIAGRVGRFGRPGRVVTVVTPAECAKMLAVLRTLRKTPVRFQHFD
ncbi:P-loop containing nucleoside triphosphate hydrolase protein [Gymnopilus junonius]|uniref:ATP-dependent RNA helicase n=1 Tax=Gymnopilus junonius TaxID=109634 RepID=A0A9P5TTA5_GYMJU|nr:P-loop containing nucleoside triphosphate hydrolase protein [Gymnopilus junonius]